MEHYTKSRKQSLQEIYASYVSIGMASKLETINAPLLYLARSRNK
jgi:hypothetical protein